MKQSADDNFKFDENSRKFFNPLPDDKFWTSKLKEVADDNFKFDENGRKLSKQKENTVRKGEIAHYEQFLLFTQCFQKACFQGASKGVIVWEWVKWVENTVGKGEIAHYKQFLFSNSVFKSLVSQRCQKVSLCGNGLSIVVNRNTLSKW